ncbi:MAG: hypothetical protein AC479_04350 [miscellaneous Crenarchaeota group-6 archaeon AD8-1]|nr:MAG: hypothetical protein AC479_04350 [miscellaneous Crenarchaeota group-6 archaeon AD8-1]
MTDLTIMIIRQEIKNDNYNELFSIEAATKFQGDLGDPNFQSTYNNINIELFDGNKAKKEKITTRFDNETNQRKMAFINFIVHYGHGNSNAILGVNNDPAIDQTLDGKLQGRTISTVSCKSFDPFGNNSSTKGYLGHDNIYWILATNQPFLDDLISASTIANLKLAEGKTYQIAYDAQYLAYDNLFNKYSAADSLAGAIALQNRNTLKLKGNPNDKVV